MAEAGQIRTDRALPGQPPDSPVFRKRLADDCLLDRELHPSIAERLSRVRELPVASVANFSGVEVDPDGVWLTWQYIQGVNLEQYVAKQRSKQELVELTKELRLAVVALHSHGIVHGAIHERNVIIDPRGRVYLTHVSPLLFSDPADDDRAVAEMLARLKLAGQAGADATTFRAGGDHGLRLRAYLAAGAAIVAGILIFASILWYIHG
jgi:serine/threonine protein kinase